MGSSQASSLLIAILNFKLAKRYYGPYQVVARVGDLAYKLKLPPDSKLHLVFHISVLKECRGPLNVEEQEGFTRGECKS